MGQVIGDMTAESGRKEMKWKRLNPKDSSDHKWALMADTVEEAYKNYVFFCAPGCYAIILNVSPITMVRNIYLGFRYLGIPTQFIF